MSTANRKRQLLALLQDDPGLHEREEIEAQLAEVETALNLLDGANGEEDQRH